LSVAETADDLANTAFAEYCEAARLAQATLDRSDAMRAGRTWAAFIDLFARIPQGARVPTTLSRTADVERRP